MTEIKKNNHLLPRMIIKQWEKQNGMIYNKTTNKSRLINKYDYSKKYYYSLGKKDDFLENRISKFEAYVGRLLKKINDDTNRIEVTEKEMEVLKLYVFLQSCRTHSTSPFIKFDESGIYRNNNYFIGVPLVETQENAVEMTTSICDEFDRIMKPSETEEPCSPIHEVLAEMHIVIAKNNSNAFLVSETTAIIECTMDSDFLFSYVPISPSISLLLVKSKYFYDEETIENTKVRFGNKYGLGIKDQYISETISDIKLCYNAEIKENNKIIINYVELDETEIWDFNSVIYEDGKNILYANESELEKSKRENICRIVNVM